MTIENYIFDLDGTIIDSGKEIIADIIKASQSVCAEINEEVLPSLVGKPIGEILQESLYENSKEKREVVIKEYRKIYDDKKMYSCVLYEGVFDFLKELKSNKKNIILLTNKPMKPTENILNCLNIRQYFDDVYTIDRIKNKKTKSEVLTCLLKEKNYNPENTILLGDTVSDMNAAKENHVLGMAVLWGYEKDKNLLISHADLYIEHPVCSDFFKQIDRFNKMRIEISDMLKS